MSTAACPSMLRPARPHRGAASPGSTLGRLVDDWARRADRALASPRHRLGAFDFARSNLAQEMLRGRSSGLTRAQAHAG